MGSNTEKKTWTNLQNSYTYLSKEIKSDNFCYGKVGRAITNKKIHEFRENRKTVYNKIDPNIKLSGY